MCRQSRRAWYHALSWRYAGAMRVFEVRASSSPLCYICAKFRFCRALHCWASLRRKIAYSITQSLSHSPSSFNVPGCCVLKPLSLTATVTLQTSNVTGHHRGQKRKLRAGSRVPSLKRRCYVPSVIRLLEVADCNARHIFHRRVWYRSLSLRYACIRSSGIILTR